jgi:peptidoglycan/xylan/chitin deacetylase (PgdA/CDA1 family)
MNTKYSIEIRADDVLQTKLLTKDQIKRVKDKTLFQWFLEADKPFKEYNYPCTLAILEEGIDKEPEWVQYIKDNQYRYEIELHGREHIKYGNLTEEELIDDLFWAKKRIETEFGIKVSTWYVPFGRKGRNQYAQKVCDMMGIKLGIPETKVDSGRWLYGYQKNKQIPFNHINFHYWHEDQNKEVEKIIKILCEENIK